MNRLLCLLIVVLPQRLKRVVANRLLGWEIHPTAHLGRSVVMVEKLVMGPGAAIGPRNLIRGLYELRMGEGASISSRNQIIGIPRGAVVYQEFPDRDPSLLMEEWSMITVAHDIDVTDRVSLGRYAVIAGFRSVVLTHNLNLVTDKFVPGRVTLGERAVLMSGCTMQNGTNIPDRSIVSAGSVVTTKLRADLTLYRGNPAEAVRSLPPTLKYFQRSGHQSQVARSLEATGGITDVELDSADPELARARQ